MEVEIGVGTQRQEIVVIVGRSDRCDRDFFRTRLRRSDKLPCPAHGFDGLVIGSRGADRDDFWRPGRCSDHLDHARIEPRRNRSWTGDPANGGLLGDCVQQEPPAWRKLGNANDLDGPEQRTDVIEPLQPCLH
jgi:hypothetical protein